MKRYLVISSSGHVALLATWLIFGALLSKPRMSYYAVDLASSIPAGGPTIKETPAPVAEPEAPKAPPVPVPVKQRPLPVKEIIKVKAKPKKPEAKPVPKKQKLNLKAALAVLDQDKPRNRAGITSQSDSNITAEAGENFPYPWYLKVIANRLEEKWKPPDNFSPETISVIAFTIRKDGEVTHVLVEKSSGDSTYDELAKRAVLYSNPFPPLPAGYPEETLNVHMTFHGQ